MRVNYEGATRYVLLAGDFAFKVPRWDRWTSALWGLLANMREANFSGIDPEGSMFCPVVFHLPCGFLVVQHRCRMLTRDEWDEHYDTIEAAFKKYHGVEFKMNTFGWLDGHVVAVDYGGW